MIQLARKARSLTRSGRLARPACLAPLAASVRGSFKIGHGNGLLDSSWIAPRWIAQRPNGDLSAAWRRGGAACFYRGALAVAGDPAPLGGAAAPSPDTARLIAIRDLTAELILV